MTDPLRIFVAHKISDSDADIDAWCQAVSDRFRAVHPGPVQVTSGRDDFRFRSRPAGGWAGWANSVSTGTNLDGTPRYHVIVVPAASGTPGRATQYIIREAALAHKDVLELALDGTFHRLVVDL